MGSSEPVEKVCLTKKRPLHSKPALYICVGASAGGLRALKDLFASKKQIPGATYLVVQHLDESGKALAIEALSRLSSLEVITLKAGESLRANSVYSVPPHSLVTFDEGRILIQPALTPTKKLSVIDTLFRSVGTEYGESAVGIILSGEGADGSLGVRYLNAAGGLTLAQLPETAEHSSMPESAVATGAVDHVLSPKEIFNVIFSYANYLTPAKEDPKRLGFRHEITAAITSICEILHQKTKHDFKHYKTSTLLRRIQRRMQVLQKPSVQAYLDHLSSTPDESDILFKELLINVTSFFRDKESFETLREEVLTKLAAPSNPTRKIRIWVAGCSTGEEAYSIAILVREIFEKKQTAQEIQIIATDIDDAALNTARRGIYPTAIAEHVSAERLSKYFIKRGGKYHVSKELREMCLFSVHNLIADPPFSQIDLITCRNVLIYLGSHLQKKLFPVFHYALRQNGYLFLGTSETLTSHKELFKPINTKHRIAQRRATAIKMPSIGTSVQNYLSHFQENEKVTDVDLGLICQRIALDEMPLRYAAVNDEGQILSSSSGINKYVQIPEGAFQNNIVKLVTPTLRAALRTAFNKAKKDKRKITNDECTVRYDDDVVERTLIIVQPMPQLGDMSELYWVAFQNLGVVHGKDLKKLNGTDTVYDAQLVDQLERELSVVRHELDRSVQDLEAFNEELKSSNEELLSMNEELQSANEELETSKEEVQSSNDALQRANTDLENLLASTQIATLFLDDEYRILGFTPAIQNIYNIRLTDLGRKLSDFTSKSRNMQDYPNASTVSEALPHESELSVLDGSVYLRRVHPYRTAEDAREGLVVTFINVTELRRSEGRFLQLANSVPVITWTTNSAGEVEFFNSRWYEYTGQSHDHAKGWGWQTALHPDDLEDASVVWKQSLTTGLNYHTTYRLRHRNGVYRWFNATGVAFRDETGKIINWFGTCVDVNDQKQQVDLLERSGQAFKTIIETIPQFIWRANPDGSADYVSERFTKFVGYGPSRMTGWGWSEIIHPDDKQNVIAVWAECRELKKSVSVDFRIKLGTTQEYRWVRSEGNPFFDSNGQVIKYYGTWTDTHERVTAELARKQSEERFKVMANSAPVLVWIAGTDKKRTWFNKAWLDFTGEPMNSSMGEGWINSIHPEDKNAYLDTYDQHYGNRTAFQLEYRLKFKDGTYRWISARGVPLFTDAGEFDGFIGACLDIHEQKRLSEAVKSSEAHFRTLVDKSPAVMWITNKNAECTYLSQQWYEITGRTPEQDLGFGWVENCHPDDKEAAGKAFFSAIEARGKISIRYRLRQRDGSYRWAIDSGLPLRSDDGEFLGYIGTVVDIHEQVESEEQYADLRERFSRSVEATDLGVWYCDLPFDELIWNKEVKKHFFMPPDARVDIHLFYQHIHEGDRERTKSTIQASIDNKTPYDILYRTIDPQNPAQLHWIRAIGWTDYDEGGSPIRFDGITLNVTDEHLRQEELRRAKDDAEKAKQIAEIASESKTRFLANMSHEIRTPLSAIVGFSDLLLAKISTDHEATRYIERISRNSNQLGRLIDELLDLSKIEADKLEVEKSVIEIDSVIEDVKSAMILRAESKGIALSFKWETPRPERVFTDPVRLAQILINIVGNAVKFTEKGQVEVQLGAANGTFTAKVRDTGIGLTEDQQKRIFEPFMQADSSVTRKFGGTGLGLALAKKLALLLGGDLILERSEPLKGTVFTITIATEDPANKVKKNLVPDKNNGVEKVDLKGRTILVVDDSPDNRTIASLYLEDVGAVVVEATNGEEGYLAALKNEFDLVLMDIQMPVMDGYQAMQKLKEARYQRPVVALTAHAFKEEKERCLGLGFTGYITKPISRKALTQSIADLFAGKLIN